MKQRVAAVVVTFNRKQLLTECLDALLAQQEPVERIILIDNASSDGTPELLAERGYLAEPRIDYVRSPSNTGGAGGFHEGIKRAFEQGYDWFWIMDDDAEPLPDALAIVAPYLTAEYAAVANLKVGKDGIPQYTHRGWFDRDILSPGPVRPITAADLKVPVLEIDHASFVGLLVSRRAVEAIGLPRAEFFIHYDDVEYSTRLRQFGRMILVRDSVVRHKDAAKSALEEKRGLGKTALRVPYQRFWLDYFGTRNRIYVKRRILGGLSGLLFLAWEFLKLLRASVAVLRYDDHKWRRLRFIWSAAMSGFFGVFDNTRSRKILY